MLESIEVIRKKKKEPVTKNKPAEEVINEINVPLLRVNAKKRIVYGVVYVPMKADSHDSYMTAKTIEDMAHRWMIQSRMMDEQHDFVLGAGAPVESFIVREGDKDFVDDQGVALVGAWVLGTKVEDERVWKKILSGEILTYSIAGVAVYGKEKEMDSDWYDDDGNRTSPYGDEGEGE